MPRSGPIIVRSPPAKSLNWAFQTLDRREDCANLALVCKSRGLIQLARAQIEIGLEICDAPFDPRLDPLVNSFGLILQRL
jgi:hypothetical protein